MIESDKTVRVFIAIDPSEEVKGVLTSTIHGLAQTLSKDIRWVRPTGIHLTLKFLGDVETRVANDLLAAMGWALEDFQNGGFQLRLFRLGVFPSTRQPRVIWAGVQGDLDSLEQLHLAVDKAAARLGFSMEKGPFRPHLTLGRVRDNVAPSSRRYIGEAIVNQEPPRPVTWKVDAIHLIQSHLQPGGAIYTTLGSSYFP